MKKLSIWLYGCTAIATLIILIKIIVDHTDRQIYTMNFVYDKSGRIIVPLYLNEKEEFFLWDTGASVSTTSNQDNYETNDSVQIHSVDEVMMRAVVPGQKIKLGESVFVGQLVENDINVLGGDYINRYCWYFDFRNQKCYISNKRMELDSLNAYCIELNLDFSLSSRTPFCTIVFHDSIPIKFLFDSGYAGGVLEWNHIYTGEQAVLLPDIVYNYSNSSPNYRRLISIPKTSLIDVNQVNGLLINGGKINDIDITLFLRCIENKTDFEGYITSNFIRRFDFMYYNPLDNKITLYAKRASIPKILGTDIYQSIEMMAGKEYPFKAINY